MAGAPSAWGFDIGVTSLKAIKLQRDGDQVSVEQFEVVEHDKFLSDPDVDRDATIRATLEKFIAHHPMRREHLFIGVPGSSTFARFVKLPPVEPKKVPEIVKFEAIQQIPFPLDQVNWDYHTFQSPDSPDVEVGIFAMKKELVAQVLSNFQALNLTVHGVQMSPLAVYNAAAYDGLSDDKGTVLIDMGAEHTDLVIMDQGRLWLRTINIGGNHFTDALAKSFKQSFSRAEALKKQAATSKYQKQIFQAMRPIFADLVAEIQRSVGHYNSSHRDSKLERIVGMGNPFKLPNLQKYLQQELKMEVVRIDGFRKVKIDPKLAAAFNEQALGMATAYGLAVQGLGHAPIKTNLLPPEIARAMAWRRKQPWFIGAAACVGLSVAAVGGYVWNERSAFASSQSSERRQHNDSVIGQENILKSNWNSNVNQGQFDAQKTQVEQSLTLARARQIWPQLTLDIYQTLPQALTAAATQPTTQAADSQPAQPHTVVLTHILSDYNGVLSSVNVTTGVATPGTPAPVTVTPENPENGEQPPPSAAPSSINPAINTAVEGPSDHGFVVTIIGYCPNVPGLEPYDIAQQYMQTLASRHPVSQAADPNCLYYFTDFTLSGATIPPPIPGAGPNTGAETSIGPWAKGSGSFRDIYNRELSGAKPDAAKIINPNDPNAASQQDTIATGNFGGPIDAFTRDPSKGITYMYNYYQFTIQFKVHVK
ncbi:MAG TPA: type IV pilus assembly protein PilM [Phycisphaerae bacterium]|nr:type IV pilus assembly protein PilM [Phycisphaerae bacterium]